MLRVIAVLLFALILLWFAGHLFYTRKAEESTGHIQQFWIPHLARIPFSALDTRARAS